MTFDPLLPICTRMRENWRHFSTFALNLLSLFNTNLQSLYLETHFQESSKANFLNSLYKNCSLLKKQLKTKERIYDSKEL